MRFFPFVASLMSLLAVPAQGQVPGSRQTAKLMIVACSQDFYHPMRETCDWWLRGAVEGFQAAAPADPADRKFCFAEKWPLTETVRIMFVEWGDRNPGGLEVLRTTGLLAALGEAYPCAD